MGDIVYSDITITRPVTEADQEWINHLRTTLRILHQKDTLKGGHWEQEKDHLTTARPTFTGIAPLRAIPCHTTHPLI
jgi:hypothetical protein